MKVDYPIITEKTDNDLYKMLMGAVVHQFFPRAHAVYEFFNRGKTQFPDGFSDELSQQIHYMSAASTSEKETAWLRTLPFLRPEYVDWFNGYRFNPDEVRIRQSGGDISLKVSTSWQRGIYWEVPLMSIISELYFEMTGVKLDPNWLERVHRKGLNLSKHGCLWSDFGTRRRRSLKVQESMVRNMKLYKGFAGTSNIHLAYLNEIAPIGTMAHECMMAVSAAYGVNLANKMWRKLWRNYYGDQVSVFLTDTFTTDVFLRDFDAEEAEQWQGLRQDSGDPYRWTTEKIIPHYQRLGVSLAKKKLVYSNALDDEEFVAISEKYRDIAIPFAGIGTNLSNDTFTAEDEAKGVKPLNMVIKLTEIDFGGGSIPVVKLSDDVSKHTGKPDKVKRVMKELGLD